MTPALPAGWEIQRLDEVADVRLGRQRSPKNHQGLQMRPYLRAANVGWAGLLLDDVKQMNFTEEEMGVYRLAPNDIVLSEASGSPDEVGKSAIWSGELSDCAFQNTLLRVRSHGLEPKYLLHFFRYLALSRAFARRSRGVGIHHIGRAALASWPVPVPPLGEQRRIVEILEDHLSRLDAGSRLVVNSRTRLDRVGDAAAQIALAEARGCSASRRLDEIVQAGRKIAYGVLVPGPHVDGGVPLIRVGDLHGGRIKVDEMKRIAPEVAGKFQRTFVEGGEVLLTLVGTIGRTAVVPAQLAGANVARAVGVLPLAAEVEPGFASMVLSSPEVRDLLNRQAHEVARKTLNLEDVRRLTIPVPDLPDQARILDRYRATTHGVDRLTEAAEIALARSEQLVRSLLAAAYSGRLTSRSGIGTPETELVHA